ncbi:MAG: metallophosphoesterase [Verrucomicrobiaceae bacterium]|nr:metallophosphoesterase [Verrucomicrobiaceae bacterium]
MNTPNYDLIGDTHGQYDKLAALLRHLDYEPVGSTWKHPRGRKVIFLGDYVDRGPKIRAVLQTVRGMCDAGDALAIMGNHEYNAVCFATPDGQGGHLRQHNERHTRSHRATLEQFAHLQDEWNEWLDWMKRLPFALDLGGLRCVHACWDPRGLGVLEGKSLMDDAFLRTSATKHTPEHQAIETVLKGPEVPATAGNMFRDKEGTYRSTVRTRWWDIRAGLNIGELAMPPGSLDDSCPLDEARLQRLPNYGFDDPPVFCGHYWLPADSP